MSKRVPLRVRKVFFYAIWPLVEVAAFLYEDYGAIREAWREYQFQRPRASELVPTARKYMDYIKNYQEPTE